MSSLTRYGRRLTRSPLLVDAIIAAACFLSAVTNAMISNRFGWGVAALALANALPLLWRRRYPLLIVAIVGVSTTWLAVLEAVGHFPAAQLVATYTFAALSPPARRAIGVLGTAAGITISLVVPQEPVLTAGPVAFSFVVAYALGTSARARRDRIAMLEERNRRHAEEQAVAATRERERIAREMHDILAHSLSLIAVQAEAGPVAVRRDPDKAEQVFDTIADTARDTLAQLRRTLGRLRPGGTDSDRQPQPDLAALPSLIGTVRRTGLDVTLEEHGEPRPVPPDLATTAYRIVQESLTNTVKHARADRALVRLTWHADSLRLEVRDDGRGRTGGPTGGSGSLTGGSGSPTGDVSGHGLIGMRERVALAGGKLTTGPGTGGAGYQVTATLPLP